MQATKFEFTNFENQQFLLPDMSKQLLLNLNGNHSGHFKKFLDGLQHEPRIAWYPSAGNDFRALMFLDPLYRDAFLPGINLPAPPDLFLYSDYFPYEYGELPWSGQRYSEVMYRDKKTTVKIESLEELLRISLPVHSHLVISEAGPRTNRVFFMQVAVESSLLGTICYPVLYVFSENEAFCAEKMLPQQAKLSHIILVRYGSGFGGGRCSGSWISHVLKKLDCENFVTDGHHVNDPPDYFLTRTYPSLCNSEKSGLQELALFPHEWSGFRVKWYKVV